MVAIVDEGVERPSVETDSNVPEALAVDVEETTVVVARLPPASGEPDDKEAVVSASVPLLTVVTLDVVVCSAVETVRDAAGESVLEAVVVAPTVDRPRLAAALLLAAVVPEMVGGASLEEVVEDIEAMVDGGTPIAGEVPPACVAEGADVAVVETAAVPEEVRLDPVEEDSR